MIRASKRVVSPSSLACAILLFTAGLLIADEPGVFDVRNFGAAGDGRAVDTKAINDAISAANAAGGGQVRFPRGTYLSASIRLRSNIELRLESGAVIEAVSESVAPYDARETNSWMNFQDSGHSHWHDSLIWGEDLENVSITGPGLIYGKGLHNGLYTGVYRDTPPGSGNKAIALVRCRNVVLRDFGILHGGWFGILATGVDNLRIENLRIDTNRDGMDVDCCRNVRISGCWVNSPWDDGICLKSSYALGRLQPTENVTISDCYVTGGYVEGTLMDGTLQRSAKNVSRMGRIKFGTESNGGFKNIAIVNCVFEDSWGLAIETVDGGVIEDVTVDNLAMRDIANAPIFIRLGNRARGPDHPQPGTVRRVNISNVTVSSASPQPSIISGIPGHAIEEVRISNFHVEQPGGGTAPQAEAHPPEKEAAYPEPSMFGDMPAWGFFVRHARAVDFSHIRFASRVPDLRAVFAFEDVRDAEIDFVHFPVVPDRPAFRLEGVEDLRIVNSAPARDRQVKRATAKSF
ncbi:MAG: glycoside hydrolase family 28 protein [Verrucomicrobiota bacterium]